MLPDSLMIDVELSPEFRDGGGNHLKIEEGKSKRFCFSIDALGKTEIVERIEIDVDLPDDELAVIDCPDEEIPEEIDGVLCAHLVKVYLKYRAINKVNNLEFDQKMALACLLHL
jgi:hypothetical protein